MPQRTRTRHNLVSDERYSDDGEWVLTSCVDIVGPQMLRAAKQNVALVALDTVLPFEGQGAKKLTTIPLTWTSTVLGGLAET